MSEDMKGEVALSGLMVSDGQLIIALQKAQHAIQPATKTSMNPAFRSKYADLSDVWEACREPLRENGLAVSFTIRHNGDGRCEYVLTLYHVSGERHESVLPLLSNFAKPQEVGSMLTYYRRYMLASMFNIPTEDDDGEAATAPHRNQGQGGRGSYDQGRGDRRQERREPSRESQTRSASPRDREQREPVGDNRSAPVQDSTPSHPPEEAPKAEKAKDTRSYEQLVSDAATKYSIPLRDLHRELLSEAIADGVTKDPGGALDNEGVIEVMRHVFMRERVAVIRWLKTIVADYSK